MNKEYTHISNKDYIIKDENGKLRTVHVFKDNTLIEEILIKENDKEQIENLIQIEYDNIVNIKNNNTLNIIIDLTAMVIATSIIITFILTSSTMMPTVILTTCTSTYIVDKLITIMFLDTKRNRKKNMNISKAKITILEEKLNSIKTEIRNLKNKADFKDNNYIKIPSKKMKYKKIDLSKQEDISTYESELNNKFKPKTRKLKKK